eukprot:6093856-Prymnesium_polylepis.1
MGSGKATAGGHGREWELTYSPIAPSPSHALKDHFDYVVEDERGASSSSVRVDILVHPKSVVPVVRLGVLLPMYGTEAAGRIPMPWSPRLGVFQALEELNNKSDGVADLLLPGTKLHFAYRDSRCDATESLNATLHLTQSAFGGQGVSAIIGAGCSAASVTAAQVAGSSQIPLISPASRSPSLSNALSFPFFLRTIPSEAVVAAGMVDILQNLLQYSSVALVYSTDAYGAEGAKVFSDAADSGSLDISVSTSFANNARAFAAQLRGLVRSSAT